MSIDEELAALEAVEKKATPGPWESWRDGNQQINTRYLPMAITVGASCLRPLVRPWNPSAYLAWGIKAEEHEVVRLLDEDADFIAAARNALPKLIAEVRLLRAALVAWDERTPVNNEAILRLDRKLGQP